MGFKFVEYLWYTYREIAQREFSKFTWSRPYQCHDFVFFKLYFVPWYHDFQNINPINKWYVKKNHTVVGNCLIKTAIKELGWKTISCPPCSPDLAALDFPPFAPYRTTFEDCPSMTTSCFIIDFVNSILLNHPISSGVEWKKLLDCWEAIVNNR